MPHEPLSRRRFLTASGVVALGSLSSPSPLNAAPASAYEKAVLAKKPVGYWRLGEDKGPTAADSSGKDRPGTYHGTTSFKEKGIIKGDANTAIKLDGKTAFVEIPSHKDFSQPTSGKGLSIEVWVRPDVLEFEGQTEDPYVMWLGKSEGKHHEWALRFYSKSSKERSNRISAYIFNPDGGLGAGAYFQDPLTAGEWMHIVACFDPGDADTKGAGVSIYRNGVLRLGPPKAGVLYNDPKWQIKPVAGDAPVRLGTRDKKSFLTGALDEVAIYPRVLAASEVAANFRIGATGK